MKPLAINHTKKQPTMNGDEMTCLFLVFVEKIRHLLNRLVVASVSACGEGEG
jgi:hypothetical protein